MGFQSGDNRRFITLAGVVVPKAWDSSGRVTEYALATHDERSIVLKRVGHLEELQTWLHEMVQVQGTFGLPHQGEPVFRVESIRQTARKPRRSLTADNQTPSDQ
jgi:hypothetical protein